MFGLIGYALLSLITALILSPVIKFGKDFSSYLCVFGFVYLTLLFITPTAYFVPNWYKFLGYGIASFCIFTFIFIVWKKMKKQKELLDMEEEGNEQN